MATDDREQSRLKLCRLLSEIVALLESHGESAWSSKLAESLRLVVDRDYRGVNQVLTSFGGMGSLNDLMLHPANGHGVDPQIVDDENARLSVLRERLYHAAKACRPGAT